MLLRARIVLPVTSPPIEDGAVRVAGQRLVEVGPWRELRPNSEPVQDLGEVALLPGLINAHCHLDYTRMAGGLPPPRYFPDWIKGILALKAQWSYTEYAESWIAGARMLLRTGTTTVADIEAVPELLPEVWETTPLRVISLLELINLRARRPAGEVLAEAMNKIAALPPGNQRAGLSPHALYSTSTELMRLAAAEARRRRWPLAVHVAESVDEFDMFTRGASRLHDWLSRQRDMRDCGRQTPVERLAELGGLGPNLLAVHVNYFLPGDADLLARQGASVVHCPRSHRYFQHRRFDLQTCLRAGVNVCLGTDSLASMLKEEGRLPELDMFAEMRALAAGQPGLPPETILRLATVNGARALGRAGELGELGAGALADLIAMPFAGQASEAAEAVVLGKNNVRAVMIDGQWVERPAR
jgi:cytosine/adenosine deaminase-related metal-dependent hydrolase